MQAVRGGRVLTIALGMALTAGAMCSDSLATFVIGGIITGAGGGLLFKCRRRAWQHLSS